MPREQWKEDGLRMILAGCSNMCGGAATNSIDVVKIRMQLDNELLVNRSSIDAFRNRYYSGLLHGVVRIVRDEGLSGIYRGLVPSMMREGSYSTIRMGLYEPVKRLLGATDPAHTPLWKNICAGTITGITGSAIATPTDLVKVRFQSRRPTGATAPYASTLGAFAEIYRSGGFRALYVGAGPTVMRAAIITASQVPTYDHAKHTLLNARLMSEGVPLHIVSSMLAGLTAALASSPVDLIKTRVMNQKRAATSGEKYRHALDCVAQLVRTEGPLALYKGFLPNWLRIGPHTVITFFVFEQLRRQCGIAPI